MEIRALVRSAPARLGVPIDAVEVEASAEMIRQTDAVAVSLVAE